MSGRWAVRSPSFRPASPTTALMCAMTPLTTLARTDLVQCAMMEARPFLLVGLTGGIATGKSTVATMFRGLGAVIIDADVLAREVVEPGQPALAEIVEEFGPAMLQADGRLDRKALGAIVFASADRRRRLEALTHPRIRQRFDGTLVDLTRAAFGFAPCVASGVCLTVRTAHGALRTTRSATEPRSTRSSPVRP